MSQSRRTWQRHETHVASALGVKRNGNRGAATADCENSWLAVECKSWRALPVRVTAALEQAERAAGAAQLPIAVLHELAQRHDKDLVVMRWADFIAWFGGGDDAAKETDR